MEAIANSPIVIVVPHCPVVCSDSSSIPEVVGNAAEYFDPKNRESMRTAMEKVLNSPTRRDELIECGHVRCAEFSWERCADETLEIYRGMM